LGRPHVRPLRIGLYSPFVGSTVGGGEKYLGATAEALRDAFPDAEVEILSPVPVDVERYERMLGLDLSGVRFRTPNPSPSSLRRHLARLPALRELRNLAVSAQTARASADYDLFVSMVYELPAVTRARRSVILCQFPYPRRRGLFRRALLGREIDDFALIVCQSEYVRGWVRKLWNRESVVVNPPVDVPEAEPGWDAKERIVLSVGRFFASGHSKRHDLMAQAFRDLCDAGHRGWELHLVGSVHSGYPADVEYLERVRRLADGYPIRLHADAPRDVLLDLYRRASVYWHASGYGVDTDTRPAELEHFGLSTVEAMGHGTVPVAIARAGQLEVVEDGVTGFLWEDLSQLRARTIQLMTDDGLRRCLAKAARDASFRFARSEFDMKMVAAVEPLMGELQAELSLGLGQAAGR
jgi:glycosyltransferase involved in cell wall biosynthesis